MPLLVGVCGGVTLLLGVALYRGEAVQPWGWSAATILGVALALRLCFVAAPPQLSDDLYRYLWDGRQVLSGVNPYATAPAAVTDVPAELRAVQRQINHPELVTIYPPAAQLAFAGGVLCGGATTSFKLWLVGLDLCACFLLLRLLDRLELPRWRVILYAWHPLPVLEIAGSGHIDGVGSLLLLGALLLLPDGPTSGWGRPAAAGGLLAAAGLVKLFPLVLLPFLLLLLPRNRRLVFLAGFVGLATGLLLPFLPELPHLGTTLSVYARNWEFAGFAFNLLRRLVGSGETARLLLTGAFGLTLVAVWWRLRRALATVDGVAARLRLLTTSCATMALVFLLLTPTLQPWYALVLAIFLPVCVTPASLLLCWSVFLAYRVLLPYAILGQWQEDALVTTVVTLAPLLGAGLSRLLRQRSLASPQPSCRG